MATIGRPFSMRANRGSAGADLSRDIPHDYRRRVGVYLCEARLAAELTQEQLADRLGIGHTAVSAIEVGRNSIPPELYEDVISVLNLGREEFGRFILRYTNP